MKDGVNGVACRVTKYEKRTLVQVGTEAATRYTFDLRSAAWDDDHAVRKQARAHKKWAGLAPARASSSSEVASAASHGGSDESEAQVPALSGETEVLVCRPKRKQHAPDFLQPCKALREFATGSRKRKKPLEPSVDDEQCCCKKPACAAARAERDELRVKLEAEAAVHMQLREQLRELASESADGDDASIAGAAFQHALLEILDGEDDGVDDGANSERLPAQPHRSGDAAPGCQPEQARRGRSNPPPREGPVRISFGWISITWQSAAVF